MGRISPLLIAAAGLLAVASALASPARAAAWWRVSDGRSDVWVLGAPQVAPKDFAWDTSGVQRRLAGASQLIIGAQPRDQLKAFAVLVSNAGSRTPMEVGLSPALRRRFDAVSASAGKDPNHYANWKPAVAGVMLAGDFYKASDLKPGEIEAAVRRLARKNGVREVAAAYYDAAEMAGAAEALSPTGQQICLGATLHGLEAGAPRLRSNAADWARGEPRPTAPDASDLACLAAVPQLKALNERNLTADAAAVAEALRAPGRTVAVFDLQQLTMPDGILERLRARGLTVSGPTP
ncbi:MAG: TraB/GumN family protein [Caulobacteraceae bacterium]|nr:TraB/GumN family protein [Caulobacteraceae bacterium]